MVTAGCLITQSLMLGFNNHIKVTVNMQGMFDAYIKNGFLFVCSMQNYGLIPSLSDGKIKVF